ncbi:MAG: prepilin-type N-terminal cleavage/methylation domain-containing protein, partial [Planctomycetaceae bacterium]|nr:prepilin-type N-terminal cleavage/methylation domain-containing protein [Planctomycetaceae bacterium]
MRRPRTPPRRYGFTMVELLVVILVLAILLGLLIPAVMRAIGSAKDAAVAAEINQMAQALADFKDRYGTYPPSRIIVSETGNYSSSGPRN